MKPPGVRSSLYLWKAALKHPRRPESVSTILPGAVRKIHRRSRAFRMDETSPGILVAEIGDSAGQTGFWANPTLTDLGFVRKKCVIYRSSGCALTKKAKERNLANQFVRFLQVREGATIFRKWLDGALKACTQDPVDSAGLMTTREKACRLKLLFPAPV